MNIVSKSIFMLAYRIYMRRFGFAYNPFDIKCDESCPRCLGVPLISRSELEEMLRRAEMAAEVTLPIEQFRDLVLQAMEASK